MQFLGQIEERGLPLGRIGGKKVVELILGGQNRTRRVKVFLRLGSFVVTKRRQLLGLKIGLW